MEPTNLLDKAFESLEDTITRMQAEPESLPMPPLSPAKSDFSLDSELSKPGPKPLAAAPSRMTLASESLQRMIHTTLSLPLLQDTSPENWTVNQVVHWLCAMGYENVAEDFQGNFSWLQPIVFLIKIASTAQEISGDILLELTLDALKEELNVRTYGNRFKIHCAISALREEVIRQQCIYSTNSSWDPSEHQRRRK